ncbi:MAG: glycosyltransferase family 9 protein [Gemmatimonadaceae bacterium]
MTRGKRVALMVVDVVGRVASYVPRQLWPPRPVSGEGIRKILVIEPWLIGDVVLVTPILQALRERFPLSHISLLAKPHAEVLLMHSGLADEVITVDFPWTATTGKYRPSRYDRRSIAALVQRLRASGFDLTIDCRMDIRSNAVAFATGAPRRIGYDFGGGSYLLTHTVAAAADDHHKVDDWLRLLEPIDAGGWSTAKSAADFVQRVTPLLRVTEAERSEAARRLRSLGFADEDLILGIHPGASQPRRRWPLEDFAWVADELASRDSIKPLVFLDPENYGEQMSLKADAAFVSANLRELMAMLSHCDLLICNDSGPMHIADALNVPVVGIFTTGNPVWHRPYGERQVTVGQGTGHEYFSYPARSEVLRAAERQLDRAKALRAGRIGSVG